MTIAAPAGLGKTRLAEEVLRHAAALGCEVHRGYCESHLGAEPLQPFLHMLRALFGSTAACRRRRPRRCSRAGWSGRPAPGRAPRRAAARAVDRRRRPSPPGRARRGRRGAARRWPRCATLFDALAARAPRVVFVDDVQWADDATRQVLAALGGLAGRRLFVLATTRDAVGRRRRRGDGRRRAASSRWRRSTTPRRRRRSPACCRTPTRSSPPASAARRAATRSTSRSCATPSTAQDGAARPPGARPRRRGLARHADRVARGAAAAAQAELVRAAAVVGNVVPAWLLARVAGCAEDDPLLRGLADAGPAVSRRGARHAALQARPHARRDLRLGRPAPAARAAPPHRRGAARAASRAGGEEEICEALAYHYGAGDEPAAAARYAELAGDKAMAASALDRAQAQYRAALAALDRLPPAPEVDRRWNAIAERLGLVSVFDPSREQLAVLGRAAERAAARGEPGGRRARRILARLPALRPRRPARGDPPLRARAGRRRQRRGDDPLRGADPRHARPGLRRRRATTARRSNCSTRRSASSAATSAAAAARRASRRWGCRTRSPARRRCSATAATSTPRTNASPRRSTRCAASSTRSRARCTAGAARSSCGRGGGTRAAAPALDAQRVGERVRSLYLFAMGRALAGYADWQTSRGAAALQAIADATAWIEGRDRGQYISLNHGWLAEALARRAAAPTRRAPRRRARCAAAGCATCLGEAMACRALARLAARGDGRAAARGHAPGRYLALAERAAQVRESRHEIAATQLCPPRSPSTATTAPPPARRSTPPAPPSRRCACRGTWRRPSGWRAGSERGEHGAGRGVCRPGTGIGPRCRSDAVAASGCRGAPRPARRQPARAAAGADVGALCAAKPWRNARRSARSRPTARRRRSSPPAPAPAAPDRRTRQPGTPCRRRAPSPRCRPPAAARRPR